jgi:hypothetical protein
MKQFTDDRGAQWIATAMEEATQRHHGTWYLAFHPVEDPQQRYAMPEVRWQTAATAARTLKTMSDFELRRRLNSLLVRNANVGRHSDVKAARTDTNVNAG